MILLKEVKLKLKITPKDYSEDLYSDTFRDKKLQEIRIKPKGVVELIYV